VFGPHLIIDGSRCDTRKLADRNLVEQVLNDYPAAIGMTKIGGPYMFEYQAPDPAYSGVSGLVVIAESHIAIHTFPELDYFTMDVFSCKNFDHETAIEYIRQAFDVKEMDRMLVQRGLSFKGPHHGKQGATDELIAAAEARLAAGIVSKEPAIADDESGADADVDVQVQRDAALARRGETPRQSGRMIWPQYGVTPDYGSYGADAAEHAPESGANWVQEATEPVQVNPTASISGLLDKLSATSGLGRAMGRSLDAWELLARDPQTTIALALSTPVLADGMRELLVYVVEHAYADVIVASADDLFSDLYEALGFAHFASGEDAIQSEDGRERTRAFVAGLLDELQPSAITSGAALWRELGALLPTRVPRKGLVQVAAAYGVAIVTPDLSASIIGRELMAARERGKAIRLDPTEDVAALARLVAAQPRLGVVRAGEGLQDALILQAQDVAPALGLAAPVLSGSVSIGTSRALAAGDHHVAAGVGATLALPLLVTGLAQRVPDKRRAVAHAEEAAATQELALA
jgi:S-adenosylmethionine decarboxylase